VTAEHGNISERLAGCQSFHNDLTKNTKTNRLRAHHPSRHVLWHKKRSTSIRTWKFCCTIKCLLFTSLWS